DVLTDIDDGAPLGETRAEAGVLLQAATQAIQALGDELARATGQRHRALVHLDAREDAGLGHDLRERHAVAGGLADGLVEEDGAGDVLPQVGRGQQHLAVGAAVFLGALHTDGVKPLPDGVVRLVDGDDALAGSDHRLGNFLEIFDAHVCNSWGERFVGAQAARHGPASIARRQRPNPQPVATIHAGQTRADAVAAVPGAGTRLHRMGQPGWLIRLPGCGPGAWQRETWPAAAGRTGSASASQVAQTLGDASGTDTQQLERVGATQLAGVVAGGEDDAVSLGEQVQAVQAADRRARRQQWIAGGRLEVDRIHIAQDAHAPPRTGIARQGEDRHLAAV